MQEIKQRVMESGAYLETIRDKIHFLSNEHEDRRIDFVRGTIRELWEKQEKLQAREAKLVALVKNMQEKLPPECQKVIDDNLSELLIRW